MEAVQSINRSIISHWNQRVKASESGQLEWHGLTHSECPATATIPEMLNQTDVIIHVDGQIADQQLAFQV